MARTVPVRAHRHVTAKGNPTSVRAHTRQTFYHGTTSPRAVMIKLQGLKGPTYLTASRQAAEKFATAVADREQFGYPAVVLVSADPKDLEADPQEEGFLMAFGGDPQATGAFILKSRRRATVTRAYMLKEGRREEVLAQ